MVLFTCIKCNKSFNKKSSYIIHTEHKKKPCFINTVHMALDLQQEHNFPLDLQQEHNFPLDLQQEHNFPLDLQQEHKFENNIDFSIKHKEQCIIKNTNISEVENIKDVKDVKDIVNMGDILKCEYCDKKFVKIYGLNRHLKLCNIKKDITEKLKIENEKLKNDQKIKNDLIEKLKIEIENEKLNNSIKPIIINNTVNNSTVNNNININIVNYKEEDLSKLDLKKILTYNNSFIEMVFRDIHCNPVLPENQNILLPSLTRYDIYVKLNNEWLKRNKKEILTERYTTIRGHIMELYDKERNINKSKADKEYFHFLKQIKLVDPTNVIYKPKEEKKIIDGIANVLYNHKDNIRSIDKTPLIINKNMLNK